MSLRQYHSQSAILTAINVLTHRNHAQIALPCQSLAGPKLERYNSSCVASQKAGRMTDSSPHSSSQTFEFVIAVAITIAIAMTIVIAIGWRKRYGQSKALQCLRLLTTVRVREAKRRGLKRRRCVTCRRLFIMALSLVR